MTSTTLSDRERLDFLRSKLRELALLWRYMGSHESRARAQELEAVLDYAAEAEHDTSRDDLT